MRNLSKIREIIFAILIIIFFFFLEIAFKKIRKRFPYKIIFLISKINFSIIQYIVT